MARPAARESSSTNATTIATTDDVDADSAWLDAACTELDVLGPDGAWLVGGREVRVTNLDKVLYPGRDGEAPVTKREVLAYHRTVAPFLLPYLADRPVNVHRFPDGVDAPGFWSKAHPTHAPDWVHRWHNDAADPGETQWYSVLDSASALVWAANNGGALELHPWNSTVAAPDEPRWAFVDIDPGTRTSWDETVALARLHRVALEQLGVRAAPKVTGRRGIQIWIPVAHGYDFGTTRAWVEQLSRAVGGVEPELVSWAWRVSERAGRARLDYTQNAKNKTLVAPFGVRPAPGAPVSVPITWDELDDPDLRPDRWTIRSLGARLDAVGDPLRPLLDLDQVLPPL